MSTIKEITVPDIGNFSNVEIIEMGVKEGQQVKAEETLVTLETEKAAMDVPSPMAGKITELKVKLGDKVSKGDVIALIEVQEESQKTEQAPEPEKKTPEPEVSKKAPLENEIQEIKVPDIGNFSNVEIIEVAMKEGDILKLEDPLITIETEKAAMDVPSPIAGKIKEVKVKTGDKVSQGDVIALVEAARQPVASEKPEKPEKAEKPEKIQSVEIKEKPVDYSKVHAGPATRRLAREFGIDLTKVKGTGLKNRIMTSDLHQYVKNALKGNISSGSFSIEPAPEIDFTQFGEIEVKPLSRIKKWTAKNLHRNWITIPHITQFDETDITQLENFREENKALAEEQGIKLTPLAFVIKAVVSALKTYPQFNASLASNGTDLILKKYFHIGVAVNTPSGLMVPVIRHADCLGLFELAKEIAHMGALARDGKLKAEQMMGSCFTISSLGQAGGTNFTPIINAPDVAILGISKAQIKPIFEEDKFVPRKMLPLSLSYDHRVIDGVEGANFLTHIVQQLKDIRKLLF